MSRLTHSADSSNTARPAESPPYEEENSTAGAGTSSPVYLSYLPAKSPLLAHLQHATDPHSHSSQNHCASSTSTFTNRKNQKIIQWAQQASRDQSRSRYPIPPTLLASMKQFEQQAAVEEAASVPSALSPALQQQLQQHADAISQIYQGHAQSIKSYITAHVPALDQQLRALIANGWQLEDVMHEPRGAYTDPLHKQIVVDLNITHSAMGGRSSMRASDASKISKSSQPDQVNQCADQISKAAESDATDATDATTDLTDRNAYIAALAHQIGRAQDEQPISIQSRNTYINDNLRREANGIWNELTIRDHILSRNGADIWAHCTPQWQQFIAIYERYASASASTTTTGEPDQPDQQKQKAKQDLAKVLAQLPTSAGKHTYTYADAYGEQYDSFQLPDNLAESNTLNNISLNELQDHFNQTGRILPAAQIKHCAYSKNGDFAWLTHQRSKQIELEHEPEFRGRMMAGSDVSAAVMQLLTDSTRYTPSLGRSWHYYETDWDNGSVPLHVQYGRKPAEIINVYQPPSRLPPATAISTVDVDREAWQPLNRGQSHASPIGPPSIDEAVLTGELSQVLKPCADQFGMTLEAYLQELVQPQHRRYESMEYPGYRVYRKIGHDEATGGTRFSLIAAKMENGRIVDVKAGTLIDLTFMYFPKREAIYRELKQAGWSIKFNGSGEGSSNQSIKEIQLPFGAPFITLVHEMAHAKYQENLNVDSMEANIKDRCLNEGNSLFNEYLLLDEIEACELLSSTEKNQFKQNLEQAYQQRRGNFDTEYAVYQQWRKDRDDQAAISAFGEIYSTYCPSGHPIGTTYRKTWEADYHIMTGDKTPQKLLSKLEQQIGKTPQVWDEAVGWESASINNVALIYPLPPQPKKGEEKILFISRDTLYRETKDYDPRLFRSLVNNGLKYGDINVTEGLGSNVKIATATFNQGWIDYCVRYHYDDSGQVFALKIETPKAEVDAAKVEPPDVVVPSAAA